MPLVGWRLLIAIDSALVTSVEVCDESIDQPTTRRRERVQHDRAVDLALAGRMLGDVGDPQPVGIVAAEVAVDEVTRCRGVVLGSTPFVPGSPLSPARRINISTAL